MSGRSRQRGGAVHSEDHVRRCLTSASRGRRAAQRGTRRTVLRRLPCMRRLGSASLSSPPRPSSRAGNARRESYKLIWSAATHGDEATASPARRRRAPGGTRTPMSNVCISGRANGAERNHAKFASRAPLDAIVRRRLVSHTKTAPTGTARTEYPSADATFYIGAVIKMPFASPAVGYAMFLVICLLYSFVFYP
jgi:hypothetical protein